MVVVIVTNNPRLFINIFSMPDGNNVNNKLTVKNIIDNTIVANPDSITIPSY